MAKRPGSYIIPRILRFTLRFLEPVVVDKTARLSILNGTIQDAIAADERAIDLATRFGYTLPNAYKSLGGALKELVEQTRKKRRRTFYEDRLEALRKSAGKARAEMAQQQGSRQSVSSENVYG